MQDRFKLRAWDKDDKAVVYLYSDGNLRDKDGIIHGSDRDLMEGKIFTNLMQCTALKDKNGKQVNIYKEQE